MVEHGSDACPMEVLPYRWVQTESSFAPLLMEEDISLRGLIRFRCSGGMCLALGGKELHMQHSEGFFILLSRGYVTIF